MRRGTGVLLVGAALLVASCSAGGGAPGTPTGAGTGAASGPAAGPPDAAAPKADEAALVAGVDHGSIATVHPARLAPGLVPPSNRWYSGLVFGDAPQPVFPLPESFALTATGFTVGLPHPTAQANVIAAPHVPAVTVDAGAATAQVTACFFWSGASGRILPIQISLA